MGMFDHVYCEIPLPDGFAGDMQTRDFDCLFGTLLIRGDGRLIVEQCDWEEVPLEERPNPEFPLLGARGAINKRWRDLDFHGDFRFYGAQESDGKRHEYAARFTHGTLESLNLMPEQAYPLVSAGMAKVHSATARGRLDRIITALPEDPRRILESRAVALITEAMKELDDFSAERAAR